MVLILVFYFTPEFISVNFFSFCKMEVSICYDNDHKVAFIELSVFNAMQ